MFENTNKKPAPLPFHASTDEERRKHYEIEEQKIVEEMNETMDVKPRLKQYFYDYLVMNNHRYHVLDPEDARAYTHQKEQMERKMALSYLGSCLTISGIYFWKNGFQRKIPKWRYGVKLFAIMFLLPTIPANILSMRLCANDRQKLIEIADKYPVRDEGLFRDFIAYALPKLKEKCYEEMDNRKKESI